MRPFRSLRLKLAIRVRTSFERAREPVSSSILGRTQQKQQWDNERPHATQPLYSLTNGHCICHDVRSIRALEVSHTRPETKYCNNLIGPNLENFYRIKWRSRKRILYSVRNRLVLFLALIISSAPQLSAEKSYYFQPRGMSTRH